MQFYFPESGSPLGEAMVMFSDFAHLAMVFVGSFVGILGVYLVSSKLGNRFLEENRLLETIWTIFPCFILLSLAFPSLWLLYLSDASGSPSNTLSVMGKQWAWMYDGVDSYMTYSIPRLLTTTYSPTVSLGLTQVNISSLDVIHSFALPSLALKVDAIPGKILTSYIHPTLPGIYTGQCSEICGANHSFMPSRIEAI